jgi:hypothetical protein
MSSAMEFYKKNQMMIIGAIVAIIVGFIVYKYYFAEGFENNNKKSGPTGIQQKRKLRKQIETQPIEDFEEDFDEADGTEGFDQEDVDNEGFDQEDVDNEGFDQENAGTEGFDQYEEEFDGADDAEGFDQENVEENFDNNNEEYDE